MTEPQRARPDFDRGPWWWRLRCDLADVFAGWACKLDPDDRTSVSWTLENDHIVIARARRTG